MAINIPALAPWLVPQETPGQSLARGVQTGAQLVDVVLRAKNAAINQYEQTVRAQNEIRLRRGLAEFGAYMGSVTDWTSPEAEAGAWNIAANNPWIANTPAFQIGIKNFETARNAKLQSESRETIAGARTDAMRDIAQARIDLGYERLQTQWDIASERFKNMSDLQKSRLSNALEVARIRGIRPEVALISQLRDMKNERDVAIFNADFDKADELQEDIDLVLQNAKANSTVTQRDWEFYNTLKSESETSADAFLRMKYGGRLPGDKLEAFGQSERKRLKNQIARVEIGVTKAMGREKREQMALLEQYRQELKNLEDAIARPTPTPAPKLPPVPIDVNVGPPAPATVVPPATAPEGFTEMINPQGQRVRVPNSRVGEARSKGYR